MSFCLVSCSANQVGTEASTTEKETSSVLNESTSSTKKGETKAEKETTTKKSTFEKLNDTFSGTTKEKTTKAQSTTKKKSTTTKKGSKPVTDSKNYCYVTVECKEILSHKDKLVANHEKYIPSNGYLINAYKVEVSSDSTVYSVLKEACKHYNYYINAENSAYGIYIKGINQIDEKDCGRESGWTFSVNSKYPSKSADKVSVCKGDKIKFSYLCEYE